MRNVAVSILRATRLGPALRAFLRKVEGTVHPLRRTRTLSRLTDGDLPSRLLFVCHGNICRSPYAAAAFERNFPEQRRSEVEVLSAGFLEAGRPSPPEAVAAGALRGVDLAGHRSVTLRPEHYAVGTLIVVMEAAQGPVAAALLGARPQDVLILGDLDPDPVAARDVPDPIGQSVDVFDRTYARIDRCVSSLVEALERDAP